MRIAFRVDASREIGSGHVMRCLALADTARRSGWRTSFLCRAFDGHLGAWIEAAGHELHWLRPPAAGSAPDSGPAHLAWLGTTPDDDARATSAALGDSVEVLVVDHYAIDAGWETALRDHARVVVAIDDIADRLHACDVLIDQNFFENAALRYRDLVPGSTVQLLGPRYALLRSEFTGLAPDRDGLDPRGVQRLLVMFGGADTADLTGRTVDALIAIGFDRDVVVVAGPRYQPIEALQRKVAQLEHGELIRSPPRIAALMASADGAIGAPGVSSYERAAALLPTLAISCAANQHPLGRSLEQVGVHRFAGDSASLSDADLGDALRRFVDDGPGLRRQVAAMQGFCDGNGTVRVMDALQQTVAHTAVPLH